VISIRSLLTLGLLLIFTAFIFTSMFGNVAYGQNCSATVDQTVAICSPANGATVGSPVQFTAVALDNEHPITGMVLYIDSQIKGQSSSANLSASVVLSGGSHAVVIRAWDSTGFFFSSQENIVVTPLTVAISASPAQIMQGQSSTLTITAQNASQLVVTNNVDSTSQSLASSGGTLSVSPAQTTTYTATATAADGTKATSSAIVTVAASGSITAVNHVIFMLQENRSFDTYFGMLNPYRRAHNWNIGDDGRQYDVDGIDDKLTTISNQDDEGASFNLFHATSSCLDDMTSSWLESYGDVSRWDFTPSRTIAMDGFVHTAENFAKSGAGTGAFTDLTGQRAMAYYADTDSTGANPELNYYYYMASQFALSDRWFSPVSSKTVPNRIATISGGTSQGYVFDPGANDSAPQLNAQTVFQLLDNNHITWKIYYSHTDADGSPSTTFKYFTYSNTFIFRNSSGALVVDGTHIAPISQYFTDVQNATLPQFAYIETDFGASDEHPGSGQSILAGQQQVANIINALMVSPSWVDSVFFLGFDEGGGPYDHVPPVPGHTNQNTSAALANLEGDVMPIAVNPDSFLPCAPQTAGVYNNHCDLRPGGPGTNPNDAAAQFGFAAQIGFRVPNMIVSPFTRKHYVGHAAMDHTAVIHFLEERFNLPALTKRDAAQPNLLDFFDFTNKPWATPPAQGQIPTPPPVGSTCHAGSFN
jgi:phospholipase C